METPAYLIALRAHYPLHPVFQHITPTEAVLTEHPHTAETDPTRLAYTRNEKDGEDFLINGHKRQTLTSVTKYLRRHYPEMKDHEIFALSQQHEEFFFVTDIKEIIHAVETGPSSCMKSASPVCAHPWKEEKQTPVMLEWVKDDTKPEPKWDLHPYFVYGYLGWSLAVHKGASPLNGSHAIVGRALVYKDRFVRSFYQSKESDGYSGADSALEAWLQAQGAEKACEWENGTPIALVQTDYGHLLPYIDGNSREVISYKDRCEIVACDGEYVADNTNGTGTEAEEDTVGDCSVCGYSIHEDYEYLRGDPDRLICSECIDEYTYVRAIDDSGAAVHWYVHDSDVVYVDGDAWDEENLPEDIVQLEGGDYAQVDDAVCVGDYYYSTDDCRICEVDGEYYLKEDCWEDVDGEVHHKDTEYVIVDGEKYTVDDARVAPVQGTAEYFLVEDGWVDAEGGVHHRGEESHDLEGRLYTTAQRDAFLRTYQIELEFV